MPLAERRPRAASALLLGATIVFVTLNLRAPVAGVGPVLDDIRDDVGLSNAAAGLLSTVPVLCFGLAAPLSPRLVRGSSEERVLFGCLLALVGGIALRVFPQAAPLFAGTIIVGIALAVVNVLLPGIIKHQFQRPGPMLGWYTMALNAGAAVAAAFTVPLEGALGSWRWALAAWAVPAAIAAVAWAPRAVGTRAPAPDPGRPRVTLWRNRTAQMITALFSCQALLFYACLTWVPDILRDAGDSSATAGALLSIVLILGLPASALVPPLAARMRNQRPLVAIASALWITGVLGLLIAPGTASAVWMAALGLAQGAGLSIALTLVVLRSPDGEHAAVLSGMVQGVGYTVAALGPLVVGLVHDVTGGWESSMIVLLVVCAGFLVFGLIAAGSPAIARR